MPGVFGAMIKQQGQNATQNYSGFNSAVWPSDPTQQVYGMKTYFNNTNTTSGMSDGSGQGGTSTNGPNTFPTSFGSDAAYGLSSNFQVIIACYKPWMNLSLGAWDSTAGSGGTAGAGSATHGGTKADWSALSASVSALSTACVAASAQLYVILWQEIEHMHAPPSPGGGMNLTAAQYWSMLSWYGNAVYGSVGSGGAGLPMTRLLHNSSASYSGQLDAFFPGGQTGSGKPSTALVGGGTTDAYSRDYAAGYRLNSVTAQSKYTTPLTSHCASAGIPFMGVLEFGVGGNNVPSNATILAYMDHVNTVAAIYPSAFYFWYGEFQDSSYGLIPGFASGQSFTETNPNPPPATITIGPGPDCTPKLRTLAATLAGVSLSVTTTTLPGATAGASYSATLAAAGGTSPYTWSKVSGALPSGLSLHAGTGVISGIPGAAGSSTFVAEVTDSTGAIATSGSLSITVAATTLVVTTASLPSGTVGVKYGAQMTAANGTPPYTWALATGSWPPGLSMDSTGLITGTPTTAGGSTVTVQVTDAAPATATSGSLPITIFAQLLNITTTSLPAGTPGVAYSATLAATGGVTPYTWSLAAGSNPLPAGFSLNSSTGALSCSSPVAGSAFVTFQVTDNAGTTDQQPLLVIVGVNTPGQVGVSVRSGGTWAAAAPQVWSGSAWVPGSLYTLTSGGEWQ